MKNKIMDQPYCGVRGEFIKTATPTLDPVVLGYMKEFIQDRYDIHIKKDVQGLPAPWTTNPIFLDVKFTNVRREHDRQTKEYMDIIGSAQIPWFDKFWNSIMFRMFNISTIWRECNGGKPFNISSLPRPDVQAELREKITTLMAMGKPVFTNAFNTGGLKQSLALPDYDVDTCMDQRRGTLQVTLEDGSKADYKTNREKLLSGEMKAKEFEAFMPMRIIRYVAHASNKLMPNLHQEVKGADHQQEAYLRMMGIRGFSRFLAYQSFVDLTYCEEFEFSENEFTVSGPGCDAGIDKLFLDRAGMSPAECVFWLRDNQHIFDIDFNSLMWDLDEADRTMNVMSLENCFCELSKYVRCKEAIASGKKPRGKVSTAKLVSSEPQTFVKIPNTKKLF